MKERRGEERKRIPFPIAIKNCVCCCCCCFVHNGTHRIERNANFAHYTNWWWWWWWWCRRLDFASLTSTHLSYTKMRDVKEGGRKRFEK
jgi:hypothetical protein